MHAKNVLGKCHQKDKSLQFSYEHNVPKQQLILQPKFNLIKDMYENNELRHFSAASCWWKEV